MAGLNDSIGMASDGEAARAPLWQTEAAQEAQPPSAQGALAGPEEVLRAASAPLKEPVSLDTLTEEERKKVLAAYIRGRDAANSHYQSVVEPQILKRKAVYDADDKHYEKKFPNLSKTSRWVSKDVKTCCEWIQAGLMEAFTGSEEPLTVKGVSAEDDAKAEVIQQLVRYQLEKKNDWYDFVKDEVRYALSENFAVAKVWWKREEELTPYVMMLDMRDDAQPLALVQQITAGRARVRSMAPLPDAPDLYRVDYDEVKVKANHPVVEFIPASELRYTPDEARLQECKFVAQRKVVKGDYLKRRERDGVYKGVDEALRAESGDTTATALEWAVDPWRQDRQRATDDGDLATRKAELYEAYLWVDYDGDGILENLIVHAVGDRLLRVAENGYGFPPFFICSAFYDPNKVFSDESFADNLEQLQDLKTAMMRQIITNVAKNNSPRVFANERMVDMDALMNGDEIIPVQGDPSASLFVPPSLPLSSVSMTVVQYAQTELEAQSGSTRYNQGLDSNALNKTATGIVSILGQAEKKNKMIARSMAERFFVPIFRFLILLNQKYLEDEQMVRLANADVPIRREELDIDYDLVINVGQGAGTREAQIQYLTMVLNQVYPSLVTAGIANAKSLYNIVCKLLEALGLRDVGQYLLDPDSPQAQQAAQQAAARAEEERTKRLSESLALAAAKSSIPRVSSKLTDMPVDAQKQYMEQKLGVETSEEDIARHQAMLRMEEGASRNG